jgi:hypothetical protein
MDAAEGHPHFWFIVDLVARAHGTPRMAPSGFT